MHYEASHPYPGVFTGALQGQGALSLSLQQSIITSTTLWRLDNLKSPRRGRSGPSTSRVRARAQAIVQEHAYEAGVLRHDFGVIAYGIHPDEVGAQLALAELNSLSVSLPSDRHILVSGYVD